MTRTKRYLSMVILLCLTLAVPAMAFQELPVTPNVKIGKLDNGFTYYLHPNPKPENRIQFRLVVNAGSLQEDDNQQGLAHFTEHMLFNGTKNFEKNELVSFLQKMGLEFGGDLNAYTNFNETVYFLPIPSDNPENVTNALTVLSDWASNATFNNEEIDKERGVVMEEWRLGRGAGQRMREQTWPITYRGSKYAERIPIGKQSILETFEYETLKQFYRDWYRPDLMALVAVGDFDAEEMEQMVKERFSGLKMPANPREREYYGLDDFSTTRVAVATDDESTGNSITINFLTPGMDTTSWDMKKYRNSLMSGLYSRMINQRLDEKRQAKNPPYLFSYSGYGGSLVRNKNEYTVYVSVKDGMFEEGLRAAMVENERVRRFGFTAGELERAKASYLNSMERSAREADKRESRRIVNSYVNHFLRGSMIMSPQQRLDIASSLIPEITVDEINQLIKGWLRDDNRSIVVNAKTDRRDDIPTEDVLSSILDDVRKDASITAYVEKEIATSLLANVPKKGSVISTETNAITGVTQMKLSNGANVFVKSTDFKNDEIRMTAFSPGGHSLYSDDDFFTASYASQIVSASGLGEMSAIDLRKFMTGKTANVQNYIGAYEEGLSGFASLKDAETFFQLVYKKFTDVRRDEGAFNSWLSRTKNQLTNFLSSPELSYQIELQRILTDNHPRGVGFPKAEDFDKINLDRSLAIYKERFGDASDFNFVFVGNIDMATFKPLVETYIASLPSLNRGDVAKDLNIRPPKGVINKNLYYGVDKKSLVNITMSGDYDYDLQTNANMNAVASLVSNKMIETLREDMGGVYGAGARAATLKEPWESFRFSISFPCDPDNVDALIEAAMNELEKVKAGDFTEEDLNKVISARVNNFDEQIKNNGYWERMMAAYLRNDLNMEDILKANERNKAITKEAIVEAASKYLTKENMITIVKLPEEYKTKDTKINPEVKKN